MYPIDNYCCDGRIPYPEDETETIVAAAAAQGIFGRGMGW